MTGRRYLRGALTALWAAWENAQMQLLENLRGLDQHHRLIKGKNLLVTRTGLLLPKCLLCAGITCLPCRDFYLQQYLCF